LPTQISHDRAKKGTEMLMILALAAAYGGWRAARAALESLGDLPQCNDDMVFF
jgi:hypothetical protein